MEFVCVKCSAASFITVTQWSWDQTVADDITQEVRYFTQVILFPATLYSTTFTWWLKLLVTFQITHICFFGNQILTKTNKRKHILMPEKHWTLNVIIVQVRTGWGTSRMGVFDFHQWYCNTISLLWLVYDPNNDLDTFINAVWRMFDPQTAVWLFPETVPSIRVPGG